MGPVVNETVPKAVALENAKTGTLILEVQEIDPKEVLELRDEGLTVTPPGEATGAPKALVEERDAGVTRRSPGVAVGVPRALED